MPNFARHCVKVNKSCVKTNFTRNIQSFHRQSFKNIQTVSSKKMARNLGIKKRFHHLV